VWKGRGAVDVAEADVIDKIMMIFGCSFVAVAAVAN